MGIFKRNRRGLHVIGRRVEPKPGEWGPLSEPVDALETMERMRAQSILSGPLIGQCPPLTLEQARDVLRWHQPNGDAAT